MIYESFFNNKMVADSIIYKFNKNQSDIVFIIPEKPFKKRIRELKKAGLSSIMMR